MISYFKAAFAAVVGAACVQAAALEMPGYPWVEVFTDPHLFENTPTVFRITQMKDGALLVGTEGGLFTFDGRRWRHLEIAGLKNVVGIATDRDGRLIVGSYDFPATLEPSADGQLRLQTLTPFLPKDCAEQRVFSNPVVGDDGVYFTSFHKVLRWDRHEHIDVWNTEDIFPNVFTCNGEAFVSDGRRQLFRVRGTELEPIPGTTVVPTPTHYQAQKITDAIPYRDGWLMVTEADGFRFFNGDKVTPLELAGTRAVREMPGVAIVMRSLGGGRFVVSDNQSNLLFFDQDGATTGRWGPREFPGYTTAGIFVDENKKLWTAVGNGVLRMDLDRAIRVLDQRAQWKASSDRVFALRDKRWFNAGEQTFEWVQGDYPGTGSVRPTEGIFSLYGVFDGDMFFQPKRSGDMYCRYGDGRTEWLLPQGAWIFFPSRRRPDVVYIEHEPNRMSVMRKVDGRWQAGEQASLPVEFSEVTEGDRHLWFNVGEGRVARAALEPFVKDLVVFDQNHGLPAVWIRAFNLGHEVLFAADNAIYRFDETSQRFSPDPRFAALPRESVREVRSMEADAAGNIWVGAIGSGILRRQPDGSYVWDPAALSAFGTLQIRRLQWDEAGWMWCHTANTMFAIRPDIGRQDTVPLRVHLGEVRDLRADKALIAPYLSPSAPAASFTYAQNALQFDIVAPDFVAPGAIQFQYRLRGAEDNWSSWSPISLRRYPALAEGRYVFEYRARNAHGAIVTGRPFAFSVQPPIYRTLPAYLLYVLGLVALGSAGISIYSRQLRSRNARLEALVHERTQDLEKAQRELVDASRIAGMAEVATGVLHNVGNVLNSVNVSAHVIAEHAQPAEGEKLTRIAALLREHEADLADFLTRDPKGRLVPEYLQLLASQAAADRTALREESALLRQNIEHIKEIVAMQQAHASRQVAFEALDPAALFNDAVRLDSSAATHHPIRIERQFTNVPSVQVQRGKTLQILVNLIRNAKNACDESSQEDRVIQLGLEFAGSDRVRFLVRDNGVGIAPENLTLIFSHGFTTRSKGRGFGLHSAANAAAEMKGTLVATSDGPGKGAVFILELPAAISA